MNFFKRISLILFSIVFVASQAFACQSECDQESRMSMMKLVNIKLPLVTRVHEDNAYLTITASEDLRTLLDEENLVFRHAPHSIRPLIKKSQYSHIDSDKYIWTPNAKEFRYGKIKITMDYGNQSLESNAKKSVLKTMNIKSFNGETETLLISYKLTGGYKSEESSITYLSAPDGENPYIYEINVYLEEFQLGVPFSKRHLKVYQKFNTDGSLVDNFLYYDIDGKPGTYERWKEPYTVKNTDLPDTTFEKRCMRLTQGTQVRYYENLIFGHYNIVTHPETGELSLSKIRKKTVQLPLKRVTYKIDKKSGELTENNDGGDFVRTYILDQNYENKDLVGRLNFIHRNKNDWKFYDYQKTPDKTANYRIVEYTPDKKSEIGDANGDGVIDIKDLSKTPVLVKFKDVGSQSLSFANARSTKRSFISEENYAAIATYRDGEVLLDKKSFVSRLKRTYKTAELDERIIETTEKSFSQNSEKASSSRISTAEFSPADALVTYATITSHVSDGNRVEIEGEDSGKTIDATSFLDQNGVPDYNNIPSSFINAENTKITFTIKGAYSNSDTTINMPWGNAAILQNTELVSGKSVLTLLVTEGIIGHYYAEYAYVNGNFHPISWIYTSYDGNSNLLGEYRENGLYSTSAYATTVVDNEMRWIKTTADFDGIVSEYGYSDSEMTQQLYERKYGVQSAIYGIFNDMLTRNVGSLASFASCGCSSAISGTGDALVSYYNTGNISDGLGIAGDEITLATTLLYQTYQFNNNNGDPTVAVDSYGIKIEYLYYTDPNTWDKFITEIPPGYNSTDNIYKKTHISGYDNNVSSITGKGIVPEFHTTQYRGDFDMDIEPEETWKIVTIRYGTSDSSRYVKEYYDNQERVFLKVTPIETIDYIYDIFNKLSQKIISATEGSQGDNKKIRILYVYDIMGNQKQILTQKYDSLAQLWVNVIESTTTDVSYSIENDTLWKTSVNNLSGIQRDRLGNFYEIDDSSIVLKYSESENLGIKMISKMLVNKQTKETKSVYIYQKNQNNSWTTYSTQENISINGYRVEIREFDFSENVKSRTLNHYDSYGRLTLEKSLKGPSDALLYDTKFFYYPNRSVTINSQPYNITVQGWPKSITAVNSNAIIGRKKEYIDIDSKNAGLTKKMTYATSFDPITNEPLSGNAVTYSYNDLAMVTEVWGKGEIPSKFSYDIYGNMTDMYLYNIPFSTINNWDDDTWPSELNTNIEHTQWTYNNIGQLVSKTDVFNNEQSLSYDNIGLVSSLSYADGSTFLYTYDSIGRKLCEAHSNGYTAYTYDASSNITQVLQVLFDNTVQEYTYAYGNSASQIPTLETLPDSWKLSRTMDEQGNVTSVVLKDSNGEVKYLASYSYNIQNQMTSLTANDKIISYSRNNFDSISGISLNNIANISYVYDDLGMLASVAYNSGNFELLRNSYQMGVDENLASATVSKNGSVYGQWRYMHENRSSGILSAGLYETELPSSEVVDQYSNYVYQYDTAGNLYSESNSGDISYTSNLNNQTTEITRSQNFVFPIRGKKDASGIFSVKGTQHTADENFCYGLPAYNQSPVYQEVKLEVSNGTSEKKSMKRGRAYLPEASETLTYTGSGNLASDSRWIYTWNARQRLASIETSAQAVNAEVPKVKYVYSYDWQGLKTKSEKYIWDVNNETWDLYSTNYHYYDRHNLIYERTEYVAGLKDFYGQQMQPTYNKFYYGLDLLEGLYFTGGTGGVRMIDINGIESFAFNNALGNIEALIDIETGKTFLAEYEYSPFGEIRKQSGALASTNPLRFNSRYLENEAGLYYYSYRHYLPRLKKWLSKEPIEEEGSKNLYEMVGNVPSLYFDILGSFKYYGNWGGPNHTAGQATTWDKLSPSERDRLSKLTPDDYKDNPKEAPKDDRDWCYMKHDICYGNCILKKCTAQNSNLLFQCRKACDVQLGKCLERLIRSGKMKSSYYNLTGSQIMWPSGMGAEYTK